MKMDKDILLKFLEGWKRFIVSIIDGSYIVEDKKFAIKEAKRMLRATVYMYKKNAA